MPRAWQHSLAQLDTVGGRLRLPVERNLQFRPKKSLSAYAAEATRHGSIRTGHERGPG
ncbi:DUF2958 domain-containing protein [Mesorhizobium loti]|uniref:DUF2958 domain-containing protein n=1 Tax=Rhizobium loti TaxID=381 RepID=UPI0009E4E200|nr:DUF2958 domain-containing protein [Mesorhizobium loti]